MNRPNIALEEYPFMLVSDIHADPEALERVLAKTPEVRYKCFLGDAVGYGELPGKTVDIVEGFDVGVMGNHDALVVGQNNPEIFNEEARETLAIHREMLTPKQLNLIRGFVPTFQRNGYLLFHGSPESYNDYLLNESHLKSVFEKYPEFSVFFGGHLHIPRLATYDIKTGEVDFEDIDHPFSRHILDLTKKRYLVNCPSTTSPRFNSQPGYCSLHHSSETDKTLNYYFFD